MKLKFSTLDLCAVLHNVKEKCQALRVFNIYDVDNKTYLIRFGGTDVKVVLLIESGIRMHTTEFEWPKGMMPSGFSMKLRKHLRGRRLEYARQLGCDRIVDLQFGSGEAAYHLFVELYDRGNIALTDHELTILNVLRARSDESADVRFAVREKYPIDTARPVQPPPTADILRELLTAATDGSTLRKTLAPHLVYGPALLEHALRSTGLSSNAKIGSTFNIDADLPKLHASLVEAEKVFQTIRSNKSTGFIIQKAQKSADAPLLYDEFHPCLFTQHTESTHLSFPTFDKAVDEFYSKMESQKLDTKAMQQEQTALKKLDTIRKDHETRIKALQAQQEEDIRKAGLIEKNLDLVEGVLQVIRSAVASQMDWDEIAEVVAEARDSGDPTASVICRLKLDVNCVTVRLSEPVSLDCDDSDDEQTKQKPLMIDINLANSAYANARSYYDKKKGAAKKEQKTLDSSGKALKSAEKKTKQTLKEVATAATINKARKTFWFEKFLWFISSENYIVLGGRDQQQNEQLVKRYLRPGDLYVHADLQGAASVIVKNPAGGVVPPKTLNEAGTMAVCHSAAWDAKVVTSAWWVHHDQVSKTAPTGEYISTGSFMIRGKRNFLPPCYLTFGFTLLFKLGEDSLEHHKGERRVFKADDEMLNELQSSEQQADDDEELPEVPSSEDEDSKKLEPVKEEPTEDAAMEVHSTEDCTKGDREGELISSEVEIKTEMVKLEINSDGENSVPHDQDEEADPEEVSAELPDAGELEFPDTQIDLQHIKGTREQLSRTISRQSESSSVGDRSDVQHSGKAHLSAKQRRELRRKKKGTDADGIAQENREARSADTSPAEATVKKEKPMPQPQAPPPKRGQKGKAKKMRAKYADQDEEEREAMMALLKSAGERKESKKQRQKQRAQVAQQPKNSKPQIRKPGGHKPNNQTKQDENEELTEAEKQELHQEELARNVEDALVLDSLTGLPTVDDELLFAVPMIAPYQSLLNYKYRVKLTPGSTKKGKAMKTALSAFTQEKTATTREKDLMKTLKDVDLARHLPGKVKVSAPNLQKVKTKKS